MSPMLRHARNATLAGLIALFALCVVWEAWLAPLRSGSLLWIKGLPLLLPLSGVMRGRRYTYQWLCMFILIWFVEGVMRGWADHGTRRYLALLEVALSIWIFAGAMVFARFSRPAP
ncbi:DUF2069 domain-containing protein [Chitinimonas sp.]|uniref:DUF2069 domain-containing protein n=1 Tax=Chitinimonas sp. TaxID=1934313 RepID=UPI0035AF52AF